MSSHSIGNGASPKNGSGGQMQLFEAPRPQAEAVTPSSAIAKRLKSARIEAGHDTASAAALACGWAPSRYLAHESGERPIAPKQAAIYAEAFGVSSRWLRTGEDGGEGAPAAAPVRPGACERLPVHESRNDAPTEAMLRAARDAVFRLAAERGLVPASIPWEQALSLAETWRKIADTAVIAAWKMRG